MKKILILGLVVIMALFMVGCGDDDDDNAIVTKAIFTNLTDHNVTIDLGDELINELTPDEAMSQNYSADLFDDTNEYTQTYILTGEYFDTETRSLTITKGTTEEVEITSVSGLVSVMNVFDTPINSIYIYLSNTTEYGDNLITANLAIGETVQFLKVSGNYNVLINLNDNTTHTFEGVSVTGDNVSPAISYLTVENATSSYITNKIDDQSSQTIQSNNTEMFAIDNSYENTVRLHATGYYIFTIDETFDFSSQNAVDYVIEAQGGVLNVINSTTANITELYLSPASQDTWGVDYVSGVIAPGASSAWTAEPGTWDVKIVDDEGYEAISTNIVIELNDTVNVDYTDGKKVRANSSDMKNKAHYNYPKIEGRVEAN